MKMQSSLRFSKTRQWVVKELLRRLTRLEAERKAKLEAEEKKLSPLPKR